MTGRCFPLSRFVCAALIGCLLPTTADAQAGPEGDLNQLALQWATGRYASPLVCEFDDTPRRGLRRVVITSGPPHIRPAIDRIVFVDLDAAAASRCFTDLGQSVANVLGSIEIRLSGHSRPDTAAREFTIALRREHGFEFDIITGTLRFEEVGPDAPPPRTIDFAGGKARIHLVKPGSDLARLLKDFPGVRKLLLELEAEAGERLRLPLFHAPAR